MCWQAHETVLFAWQKLNIGSSCLEVAVLGKETRNHQYDKWCIHSGILWGKDEFDWSLAGQECIQCWFHIRQVQNLTITFNLWQVTHFGLCTLQGNAGGVSTTKLGVYICAHTKLQTKLTHMERREGNLETASKRSKEAVFVLLLLTH